MPKSFISLKEHPLIFITYLSLGLVSLVQGLFSSPIENETETLDSYPVSSLPEVTVEAFKVETILQTDQSIASIDGTPFNIMDIPRSVTPINQTLMQSAGIGSQGWPDPISITMISPAAQFDAAELYEMSSPIIRGKPGLTFINGIEQNVNNDGFFNPPWNFNMVENFDLVEGPPGAVFGATQPSNGYVNYTTKQPYFDKFRGNFWNTTGMYENYIWGADIGGPIEKGKLAYRASYMGIDSRLYYQYVRNEQENFYFAIGYRPTEKYQIECYSDFGTADYTPIEVLLNRPTQSLINNGLYFTGFVPPSQVTAGTENNPPANSYLISEFPISRRSTVKYPADIGQATFAMSQVIQTLHLNDNIDIVNNSFFWYQDQTAIRFETYEANVFKGDYEIDNRTELRINFDSILKNNKNTFHLKHFIDSGLEFRFQRTLDYQSEVYLGNSWDAIIENPQLYNFLLSNYFTNFGLYPVPGSPAGGFFIPLNDETNQTQFFRLSPFYQHQMNMLGKVTLFIGARMDSYFVHSQTPPGTPTFLFQSLNTTQLNPLVNAAITYRPAHWISLYFDYNWQYTTNASGGGGYSPIFPATTFHLLNQLIEGGIKFNLLDDRFYFSLTGFSEETFLGNIDFPSTPASFQGIEASLTYQPNKHFWIRMSYLLEQGVENWSSLPEGPEMAQTYSTDFARIYQLPLNNNGTFPPGKYALIGWPDQVFNGMMTYKFDSGFGLTIGALVLSDQYLGYDYRTRIPLQFILNNSIFYSHSKWESRLNVFNFTNQKYWLPAGVGMSPTRELNYTSIVPGLPFWIQGTISYKF
ncbi:hypothetical protein A7Q09_09920 [Methylacidiphilum sp. Yel]|uniref:TonB-dependent receptor n=1 Tax=Methylacidiphilum sp. Yel TaxID=1847730 RepID=UPI00106AFFF1|nr:TonB-dependent receptor [Methylacidiphilum sp. Yel]TFE66489.1 hypothetical protein A7Q09_09920 [Methylacidiphilum sp. Yel]